MKLAAIVVEGAVDRFCGRPLWKNPYNPALAVEHYRAWAFGWWEAGDLLDLRGQQEAARWLREAA